MYLIYSFWNNWLYGKADLGTGLQQSPCPLCGQKLQADTPRARQGKSEQGVRSERLLTKGRMKARTVAVDDIRQSKQEEINLWVKSAEIRAEALQTNEVTHAGGMEGGSQVLWGFSWKMEWEEEKSQMRCKNDERGRTQP